MTLLRCNADPATDSTQSGWRRTRNGNDGHGERRSCGGQLHRGLGRAHRVNVVEIVGCDLVLGDLDNDGDGLGVGPRHIAVPVFVKSLLPKPVLEDRGGFGVCLAPCFELHGAEDSNRIGYLVNRNLVTGSETSACDRIGDNPAMPPMRKQTGKETGLYHARRAARLTQEELAKKARTTKNTVIRLEGGKAPPKGMKLTLKWAERFAPHVGYTAQQLMFWKPEFAARHADEHIESSDVMGFADQRPQFTAGARGTIRELDARAGMGGGGIPSREVRHDGDYADPLKPEEWVIPPSYLREIGRPANRLLVLESGGDSMEPTISSGERLIVDTHHRQPTPDGIYALRDTFDAIVVKRLQVIRATPPRVKIISDNQNHPAEEVSLEDIEIVGKVILGLKRF